MGDSSRGDGASSPDTQYESLDDTETDLSTYHSDSSSYKTVGDESPDSSRSRSRNSLPGLPLDGKKPDMTSPGPLDQSVESEKGNSKPRGSGLWHGVRMLAKAKCYRLYILVLLMVAYILNQIARYLIAILTKSMAKDIHYGDQICVENLSYCRVGNITDCDMFSKKECLRLSVDGCCQLEYNGGGYQYELLAGPVFTVAYTLTGVPLSIGAEKYNRTLLLCACVTFWSAMTILMGVVKDYWQLVIVRLGVGIGDAGCAPLAVSLLSDYFEPEVRPTAAGLYNWAVFVGYSLAYVLGNLVEVSLNWRWAFFICGSLGILLTLVTLFTVAEPERHAYKYDPGDYINDFMQDVDDVHWYNQLGVILKFFLTPSMVVLCMAGCARHAAGYIWAYNTQLYFESLGQSRYQIVTYMSWVPLVGGTACVILTAVVTNKFLSKMEALVKILVLIISQLLAAPFFAGALYFPPPYAYLCLIPGYMIGEAWISVAISLLAELVPVPLRSGCIAVYMFLITIIGGCLPVLVPLLQTLYKDTSIDTSTTDSLRASLYILSPGLLLVSAILFTLTLFVLKRDIHAAKRWHYEAMM